MAQADIPRNYADDTVLTAGQLDASLDYLEEFLNETKIGSDNIEDGAIGTNQLANESVTSDKLASSSVLIAKLAQEVVRKLVPTGTILPYGGDVAPDGYLMGDGAAYSRTTYAALFAVYGTRFGAGDGSTTFNVPKVNGLGLRFRDNGAGVDPDASSRTAMASGGATGDNVGSVQQDQFKAHTHTATVTDPTHDHDVTGNTTTGTLRTTLVATLNGGGVGNDVVIPNATSAELTGVTVMNSTEGGNETRMKNFYANAIIKY